MSRYEVECWFSYGCGNENDFYHITVDAPNETLAEQVAHELSTLYIYKSKIIGEDGK